MLGSVSVTFVESDIFKTYIFSGELRLLYFLGIMMVIDIILGLSKAYVNKNLWSRKSMFGYARKIYIFLVIILANILDALMHFNGVMVYITIIFYITNELLSIFENLGQIGVPLPPKLKEVLEVLRDQNVDLSQSSQKEMFSDDELDRFEKEKRKQGDL